MAAHVEVVSADLRRVKVKVTPGTYLVDVLGEACKKLNLNSDKYELKYKQKIIDLTGPYRTSGLGPGAKLELVQKSKSASVVSIALDVNGKRYTKKLPSDMTLWKVMRQFETSESGLNVTARGVPRGTNRGQLYFEAPVVNIMGREYSALEDLQKTLSQCGISSGSIVLRVSFKSTEKTLYDAMQEIGQYLNDVEPEQPKAEVKAEQTTSATETNPHADSVSDTPAPTLETPEPTSTGEATPSTTAEASSATVPMDVDESPATTASPAADPLQPTGVFSAPSSSTPAAARTQEDDSVYEPTIAHAQLRQQQLQQRSLNTRLKSDAELAAEAAEQEAKLARITRVDVKVRFPDQTSATWAITPDQTAAFLYRAIRGVMARPDQPFRLVIPAGASKTVIEENEEKKLIAGYRLRHREMVHLVWEERVPPAVRKAPFLKESVAKKATDVVVPEIPAEDGDEEVGVGGGGGAGPSGSGKVGKGDSRGKNGMDSEAVKKKLSKFLGLGKK
ncbi:hypothetical protein VTK26DRAFT_5266 [Humicola hyalothermophila]